MSSLCKRLGFTHCKTRKSQVANPISLVPRQGLCPSFVSASDCHKRTERFCAKGAIAKEKKGAVVAGEAKAPMPAPMETRQLRRRVRVLSCTTNERLTRHKIMPFEPRALALLEG